VTGGQIARLAAFVLPLGVDSSAVAAAIGAAGVTTTALRAAIAAIAPQALIAAQAGLRLGGRLSQRLREDAERAAGLALALLGSYLIITRLTG
jgi:putative Mn2+ efflux pump MntP